MDLSLDDIIAENKANRNANRSASVGRGRGGRASRGRGASSSRRGRGQYVASNQRPAPYIKRTVAEDEYQYDHEEPEPSEVRVAPASVSLHTGSKLFISNLAPDVTTEDMEELYGKFGDLKRAHVHYDSNGRSLGTAEVMFVRRQSAVQAMKEYSNVSLDGQPMIIESITKTPVEEPRVQPRAQSPPRSMRSQPMFDTPRYAQPSYRPRDYGDRGDRDRYRGGGGRGGRSGRGRDGRGGRDSKPQPTAEELNAQMAQYMAKSAAAKESKHAEN